MNYFLERMRAKVVESVAHELGVAKELVQITQPDEQFDADIAVPCFVFAKELSRNPQEIAQEIADKVSFEQIESVEAVAGYANFKIRPHCYAMGLYDDCQEIDTYGATNIGQGKTAIVDFIGLNLSKPFSVGHLRPTVQGWAIIQLLKLQSYEVIGDSHLGDWGTPFGMWVVAFEKWGSKEKLEEHGAYELGRLYVEFREKAKDDESLMDEAKSWLKKLEQGDSTAVAYKERFSDISMKHMRKVLDRLKITPDENLGESFYVEKAQELINQLIEQGVAVQQEDNSVIVDLSSEGIETPILLRKSDGSALYATSDLETINYRKERWNPSKIIYSVGGEQQFHFKQVFTLADKLGYTDGTELAHPWFGTVDDINPDTGKRTKMSSRKHTALLENLLNLAEEKAKEAVKNDMSDEDITKIAIGAIKFNDFAQPRRTNILFDWERMFSFSGYSSVYIQYAAVRINSILAGLNVEERHDIKQLKYDWNTEREILRQLSKFPDTAKAAADEYEPNLVANYLYELARTWNKYYETTSVKDSDEVALKARVWLINELHKTIETGLNLLGIELPSKM